MRLQCAYNEHSEERIILNVYFLLFRVSRCFSINTWQEPVCRQFCQEYQAGRKEFAFTSRVNVTGDEKMDFNKAMDNALHDLAVSLIPSDEQLKKSSACANNVRNYFGVLFVI